MGCVIFLKFDLKIENVIFFGMGFFVYVIKI